MGNAIFTALEQPGSPVRGPDRLLTLLMASEELIKIRVASRNCFNIMACIAGLARRPFRLTLSSPRANGDFYDGSVTEVNDLDTAPQPHRKFSEINISWDFI